MPQASPVCGQVEPMVSIDDVADRSAIALSDGETLFLGAHTVKWLETPHIPHGWETGYLMEEHTRTLLCWDLFTQGGSQLPLSPNLTSLSPVKASEKRWTISHIPVWLKRFWKSWQKSSPPLWPACMEVPGRVMGPLCLGLSVRLSQNSPLKLNLPEEAIAGHLSK